MFTTQEKLEAVEREIKIRRRVYVNRVATRRMTQRLADRQIALFEAIAEDYRELAKSERLLEIGPVVALAVGLIFVASTGAFA